MCAIPIVTCAACVSYMPAWRLGGKQEMGCQNTRARELPRTTRRCMHELSCSAEHPPQLVGGAGGDARRAWRRRMQAACACPLQVNSGLVSAEYVAPTVDTVARRGASVSTLEVRKMSARAPRSPTKGRRSGIVSPWCSGRACCNPAAAFGGRRLGAVAAPAAARHRPMCR